MNPVGVIYGVIGGIGQGSKGVKSSGFVIETRDGRGGLTRDRHVKGRGAYPVIIPCVHGIALSG